MSILLAVGIRRDLRFLKGLGAMDVDAQNGKLFLLGELIGCVATMCPQWPRWLDDSSWVIAGISVSLAHVTVLFSHINNLLEGS
jgi:hypothetical protein